MFLQNKKIDIVYTWVNNKDPLWIKKREIFSTGNITTDANNNARFENNEELKYSLRSLEKNAPWINNIFIITDNQIPDWLETNHPKIKIIDHSDIIPKEYLPIFNSISLDHCIINIPELSEYFLYACDDMFFAKKISPSFFYAYDGLPIFRFNGLFDKSSTGLHSQICFHTEECFKNTYKKYKQLNMYAHHNIDGYRKSDLIKCQQIFKQEINDSIKSRFRDTSNIERTIYALYCIFHKRGHYKGVYRADIYFPFFKNKSFNFIKKHYRPDTVAIPITNSNYNDFLTDRIKLFCINDEESATSSDRLRAKTFLEKYFPVKSQFEK